MLSRPAFLCRDYQAGFCGIKWPAWRRGGEYFVLPAVNPTDPNGLGIQGHEQLGERFWGG
jgi:hypothetical protein